MEGCDAPASKNKASFDPGWNDPPSIAYNAQQTTPNRPRNFLNKRVAFPVSGGSSIPSKPLPINLPPLPLATQTPPVNYSVSNGNNELQIDSESALLEVKGILLNILDSSSELGSKSESIKKKVSAMEEMWRSGQLNSKVQMQMKELALALKSENPVQADDIHKSLMVDHVAEVGAWMPGVKQLIYHCLARSELMAIDKEE